MAKRYAQLDSGLMVPDWLPDGRSRRRVGDPKHFIFTPGGGPCRCSTCFCDDVPIYADGTVTWFTHEVSSGVITRVDHEGPCITYYVDSVSGGGAETGSGTEDDPWTNLNTVFSDDCIYYICLHTTPDENCPKVKVLVKGTIDYMVSGDVSRYYFRQLVVEPWDADAIDVTVTSSTHYIGYGYAISRCCGVVWKRTNAHLTKDGTPTYPTYINGFWWCRGCTFENCTGIGTTTDGKNGIGFMYCLESSFHQCEGTASGSGSGYVDCPNSTFYNTTGNGKLAGFGGCHSSAFDECDGIGNWGGTYAYGFTDSRYSTFFHCTGRGEGMITGYGFEYCPYSVFDTCDGVSKTCGFYNCAFGSSFSNCTATPTGAPCDT